MTLARSERRSAARRRRGTSTVEFAVMLPFLVLLVLGLIECGRALTVQHTLSEAVRSGARIYSLKLEKTEADVRSTIDHCLSNAGVKDYTISVSPPSTQQVKHLDPLTVSVAIPYRNVSWLPSTLFFRNRTLTATCVMPADMGEVVEDAEPAASSGSTAGTDILKEGEGEKKKKKDDDDDDDDDDKKKKKGRKRPKDDDDD